jgi:hypothetical protein
MKPKATMNREQKTVQPAPESKRSTGDGVDVAFTLLNFEFLILNLFGIWDFEF